MLCRTFTVFNVIAFVLCQGPRSSGASSVLGSRQEERVSLSLPGFDDDNDEDKISENEVLYNLMTTAGSAVLNSLVDILCYNCVIFSAKSPWSRQTTEEPPSGPGRPRRRPTI